MFLKFQKVVKCSYQNKANKMTQGNLEGKDMFITLIAVTQVYTYAQPHQIVYINSVGFFAYQLKTKSWEKKKGQGKLKMCGKKGLFRNNKWLN